MTSLKPLQIVNHLHQESSRKMLTIDIQKLISNKITAHRFLFTRLSITYAFALFESITIGSNLYEFIKLYSLITLGTLFIYLNDSIKYRLPM